MIDLPPPKLIETETIEAGRFKIEVTPYKSCLELKIEGGTAMLTKDECARLAAILIRYTAY